METSGEPEEAPLDAAGSPMLSENGQLMMMPPVGDSVASWCVRRVRTGDTGDALCGDARWCSGSGIITNITITITSGTSTINSSCGRSDGGAAAAGL